MKCEDFNMQRINRYIDGELSVEQRGTLENHFKTCEFCRNYLKELQDSLSVMKERTGEAPEVPGKVWGRIQEGVHSVNRWRFIRRYVLVPVSAMAVFLFVFILTGRKDIDNTVNDYIQKQVSYLNEELLVDSWYLEEEDEGDVVDLFLRDEL